MTDNDLLVVLAASYESVADAEADYDAVKELYREAGVGHQFDAAVLERDDDGKVKVVDKHEQSTRHGAWTGLAIGALAAILPGIGLGVGAAIGAGVGAVAGHMSGGMSNDDLKELGQVLDRGKAGLIVLYATNMADQIAASIKAAEPVHLRGDRRRRRRARQAAEGGRRVAERSMKGMVPIPGGRFAMGSEDFYPEERPVREVEVDGFLMDEHPVTVAAFRRFVKETGYETVAERPPDAADYPDADPGLLVPGSLVFDPPDHPVDLRDASNWWRYRPGAQWRHPEGPDSTLHGRERHPVTHLAPDDAEAYAAWAGKDLPTEAEWEFAARGGLEGRTFVWGDEFAPKGKMMANTWQGSSRGRTSRPTGSRGRRRSRASRPTVTACTTWPATSGNGPATTSRRSEASAHACCVPRNPRATDPQASLVADQPGRIPRRVIKGGSHLCAPNYCLRYRPAARQGETDRHLDEPHRIPLRRPVTRQTDRLTGKVAIHDAAERNTMHPTPRISPRSRVLLSFVLMPAKNSEVAKRTTPRT